MTRAELRLELIRIVHHGGREPRHALEIIREYEKGFAEDGIGLDGAPDTLAPAEPKKRASR